MSRVVWTRLFKSCPIIDWNGRRSIAQKFATTSVIFFLSWVVEIHFVTNTYIAPLFDLSALVHLSLIMVMMLVVFFNMYTFLQVKHVAYSQTYHIAAHCRIFTKEQNSKKLWSKNTPFTSFGNFWCSSFFITCVVSKLELDVSISIHISDKLSRISFWKIHKYSLVQAWSD